jgi:2-oxoglutarate dehydrogenase E1 component
VRSGADGKPRQARFCVYDSPLSSTSVMGFDYGYSLADPKMLVMWEAQFGDFVNGAQVVIDQFLVSPRRSGSVGPASCCCCRTATRAPAQSTLRPPRAVPQLCGKDNMQVVYPTTAPRRFHMLRRQLKRNFRKPLVS